MREVSIYTDGSCLGNPGPGGWAALLRYGKHERELSGGESATTNNRMELIAAIEALAVLREPCIVNLYTDSQYLHHAVQRGWLSCWKRNGWRTAAKKNVKNRELWERLDALLQLHQVHLFWVRGHAGMPENERCDLLAREQAAHRGQNCQKSGILLPGRNEEKRQQERGIDCLARLSVRVAR